MVSGFFFGISSLLSLGCGPETYDVNCIIPPSECHRVKSTAKPADSGNALLSIIEPIVLELDGRVEIQLVYRLERNAVLYAVGPRFCIVPLEARHGLTRPRSCFHAPNSPPRRLAPRGYPLRSIAGNLREAAPQCHRRQDSEECARR